MALQVKVNLVLITASRVALGRMKMSHKSWGLYLFTLLNTQELRDTGQRIAVYIKGAA